MDGNDDNNLLPSTGELILDKFVKEALHVEPTILIHYTLYIIHYTLYIIHYTLYIIHYTLYTYTHTYMDMYIYI